MCKYRRIHAYNVADAALLLYGFEGPILGDDTKHSCTLHSPFIYVFMNAFVILGSDMWGQRVKNTELILAASMKNSWAVLHKRWHWQVAAIQMSGWIIYHCYLQLELQPGLPILHPKSYQSHDWWSHNAEQKGTEWSGLIYGSIPSVSSHHYRNIATKTHLSTASNQLFCSDIIKHYFWAAIV